ncbi:hypothetical protein [Maribacter halichondriae]|nr:hypothetical protein [Maribacter sp. Hal144]
MELAITIIIYIHAILGGIGLVMGFGSMAVKKEENCIKRWGLYFQ